MTNPKEYKQNDVVEVTEADREAAAEIFGAYESMAMRTKCLAGRLDMHPITEAFAKHRIAAPSGDVVEALQLLSDAADKLNGSIDEQTYDERLKLQDYPDDQEFHVVITAKQEKDFNAAIFAAQTKLRSLTTPPSNQEAALLRERVVELEAELEATREAAEDAGYFELRALKGDEN